MMSKWMTEEVKRNGKGIRINYKKNKKKQDIVENHILITLKTWHMKEK